MRSQKRYRGQALLLQMHECQACDVACDGLFAGKPAPTGIFVVHKILIHPDPVGASLLAKAISRTPSQASHAAGYSS
jgi:hypothetical protein